MRRDERATLAAGGARTATRLRVPALVERQLEVVESLAVASVASPRLCLLLQLVLLGHELVDPVSDLLVDSLVWRVFVVNAGLLGVIALLQLFTPAEIDAPIKATQALSILGGLAITVAANALLLRRAVAPLRRLAQRMDTVDLLRPGQRLPVGRSDEVGRVVAAFNHMLDRLERDPNRAAGASSPPRRPNGRHRP